MKLVKFVELACMAAGLVYMICSPVESATERPATGIAMPLMISHAHPWTIVANDSGEVPVTGYCAASSGWKCGSGSHCDAVDSDEGVCCPDGYNYSRIGFCKPE